jgi:hypothetical protein
MDIDRARLARKFKGPAVANQVLKQALPAAIKKGALKAIPYAGLVIAGYFAAQSAVRGDFMGAGLELATGIPWVGIVEAIPAIAIIVARDVYDDLYEDPANPTKFLALEADLRDDPEGTKKRLGFIQDLIVRMVKSRVDDAKDAVEQAKRTQAYSDAERKSVSSAKDIEWGSAATGNVPAARRAFNQRQRTGQEYK